MPYPKSFEINDVGVITGLDLVGDALIKLPFVRALRVAFPKAKIHWITSDGPTAFNDTLRELTHDLIDVVHEQPEWITGHRMNSSFPGPKLQALCPLFFDILIDTRNRLRKAWEIRHVVPHKIFIASAARYLVSDLRPPLLQLRSKHLVDRLLQMIELAAGFIPTVTGKLPVSEKSLTAARLLLPEGRIYVGIAPGAGNPIKIWPRENFEKLAALQVEAGRIPVFLLGPNEKDWLKKLQKTVPSALFPLQACDVWETPEITIEKTLAIGNLLNVAVANDSGTGHILAAVDCPLISLFGPTSPDKLAPRVSHGIVLSAQNFGGKTMDLIPVKVVNDAINKILQIKKSP